MKVSIFIEALRRLEINTVAGIPDSALKQFCHEMEQEGRRSFCHYVPANEGAAVGIAIGHYMATGKPACVYMQNSGLGNTVNPITSLANGKVYGIPMLLVVGWRGMPGQKDEPQHRFMGEITCSMLDNLGIPYGVLKKETQEAELEGLVDQAAGYLNRGEQFAMVAEPGTFEASGTCQRKNIWKLGREEVIREILSGISRKDVVVSTTGKISREVYEQADSLLGHHRQAFLTVGGMGHASMIAFGIAKERREQRVYCIDGDGAVLMHMGSLAFLGAQKPENLIHICLNNEAHESVGGMLTGCPGLDFAKVAKASGYPVAETLRQMEEVRDALDRVRKERKLSFLEIKVSMDSREDLGRPRETAAENKQIFMEYHEVIK